MTSQRESAIPNNETRASAMVAQFDSPETLTAAARRMRDEGFRWWDVHSPMPLHGIESAMGIRMTILPWLVLGVGITGAVAALVMQWWTNAVNYPLIISGKPLFSIPANIPVTFELIVLFSSLTAFFGALALSLLPQFWHATFGSQAFRRVSTDGFFISVEGRDAKFDEKRLKELFESLGAVHVESCHDPATGHAPPKALSWVAAFLIVLAFIPPLAIAWRRSVTTSSPRIHILKDMDSQPKYKAQTASPLFLDHRSNRLPMAGTIALGQLVLDPHLSEGKVNGQWAERFPAELPLTEATMERGRQRFEIYCAPCHGLAGDGDGAVARRAADRGEPNWVPPAQLSAANVRIQPVGQIYNSVTNGIRKMPAYRNQIPLMDRWAIVLYVKALQRSQAADESDVPPEYRVVSP